MIGTKNVLGAGLLIFTATTVNAGIYAGAGLGPDSADFNMRNQVTQLGNPGFPPSFEVFNKSHLSGIGFFGTIFAGVNYLYNQYYYIAAEVNANISSLKYTGYNNEYVNMAFTNTKITMNNNYGISILPGYQFSTNTLFYGRLGWVNSHIEQRTTDTTLANFSTRINGLRYGLGLQQALTERLAVRIDYSRIAFGSTFTRTLDVANRVPKAETLSPTQQLVEFGVVLKFA